MIDVVRKNLDAFGAGDWTAFEATLNDDAVYVELPTQLACSGRNEVATAMKRWKHAFTDAKGTIENVVEAGDKIVVEVEWNGTQDGTLEGPMGTIPPSGRHCTVSAALIFTIRNEKIAELHHYFDLMTVMRSIGAIESPGEVRAAE